MDVQGIGQTDVGLVRANNEDAFVVDVDLGLYLVCDGMGGAAGGEVASEIATTTIERMVRDRSEVLTQVRHDPTHASDLIPVLEDAFRQACRDIFNRASSEPRLAGMGCTATALLVVGAKALMAHVGDTRLYLIRSNTAHQLSSDHTLAADLVRQGSLEPERLVGHPQNHVLTRVLGPQPLVDVEMLSFDLGPGDKLIVCSDGLGDHIPTPTWLAEHVGRASLEELPDALIAFANESGGQDNTTVIAIGVGASKAVEAHQNRSPQLVLDILGSSFLFSDLSLAQLSRVVERCDARTYEAGDVLCNNGDTHDELLLIVTGALRVTTADGRSAVAGPGQHLGENFVLHPRRTRAKVVVEQRADILALDQPSLVDLASRRPWLGVALLTRLVQRMSSDIDRLTNIEPQSQPLAADLL